MYYCNIVILKYLSNSSYTSLRSLLQGYIAQYCTLHPAVLRARAPAMLNPCFSTRAFSSNAQPPKISCWCFNFQPRPPPAAYAAPAAVVPLRATESSVQSPAAGSYTLRLRHLVLHQAKLPAPAPGPQNQNTKVENPDSAFDARKMVMRKYGGVN